jgi:hypothetical protein
MIDEELYQQAADELNSDRRRAHVWARACALSKDDHDEARYLYTNLRVEELIAERDSRSGTSDVAASMDHNETLTMDSGPDISSSARVLPLDDTLDFDDDSPLNIDDASSQSDNSDLQFDYDPLLQNIAGASAPLSPMEREYYEKHPEQLKELEESDVKDPLQRVNENLDVLLDGVNFGDHDASNALSAGFSDANNDQSVIINDEIDWIDNDDDTNDPPVGLQRFTPQAREHDDTDRFTQNLLRQVDNLPGQHSGVVASEDVQADESTWEPSPRANEAAVGTAAAIGAARYGNVSEKNQQRRSTSSSADSSRFPIDLTDGKSGTEYTVFRRDQNIQAVKTGVSWSALFFTVPYLIYRHMIGTAIVYIIMSLIVAAGLIFMGLSWIDTGASASNLIKFATAGFGLLAVIGILYLPFRHGNSWRSEKLEQRGFELVARVKAGNPGKAVALARRASALD